MVAGSPHESACSSAAIAAAFFRSRTSVSLLATGSNTHRCSSNWSRLPQHESVTAAHVGRVGPPHLSLMHHASCGALHVRWIRSADPTQTLHRLNPPIQARLHEANRINVQRSISCQAAQQQQTKKKNVERKRKPKSKAGGKGFEGKRVDVAQPLDAQTIESADILEATKAEPGKSKSGSSDQLLKSLPQVSRGRIFWSCVQTSSGLAGMGLVLRQFGALPASNVLGTHTSATEVLLAGPHLGEASHWAAAAAAAAGVTLARQAALAVWPDFKAASDRANQQVLAPLQWYDLLWVGGLPGLSEELLFRGALIPSVAADWRGVLIAGATFGVLHNSGGRNWAFAGWATAVGALYGAAFLATGNIAVPMGAHVLSNIAGGLLYQLLEQPARSRKP